MAEAVGRPAEKAGPSRNEGPRGSDDMSCAVHDMHGDAVYEQCKVVWLLRNMSTTLGVL